jgi:hypothetical protein
MRWIVFDLRFFGGFEFKSEVVAQQVVIRLSVLCNAPTRFVVIAL